METKIEPLFDFWPDNYTLQQNIYGLPNLEYLQRYIPGSVLEKSKTKVLNIRLILNDFIKKDLGYKYNEEDEKIINDIKSIKTMIFKNKNIGHQLKVIGVPSVHKVQYSFRIVHSLFSKIPDPVTKKLLKYNLSYDLPKITNIVFGWFLPQKIVKKYFWDFINIEKDLKTNCTHRPQKFPQLCIKKMKPLDEYTFSCTISHKGYCTVPGQKDPDKIGELQLIILKDFLDLKDNRSYSNVEFVETPTEPSFDSSFKKIETEIRDNKLQLLNALNYEIHFENKVIPHKKIFHISKLKPLSKEYTDKTNQLYQFDKDDCCLNLHQKIQKRIFNDLGIQFDSFI
jgi:hypothetical protein